MKFLPVIVVSLCLGGFFAGMAIGRVQGARHLAATKIKVTLYLDPELVEELEVAQASRNNISLEEYITETLECAVSDRGCLPKPPGSVK